MRVVTWGLGALLVAGCGDRGECKPVVAGQLDVASIAVVDGLATIRHADGHEEPAVVDMSLARTDTVQLAGGASVVLVLVNCHVVRLSETLAVDKLSQLDAEPPARSLAASFEAVLGGDGVSKVGARRIERIAGWNARRASGETPAPVGKAAIEPVSDGGKGSAQSAAPPPSDPVVTPDKGPDLTPGAADPALAPPEPIVPVQADDTPQSAPGAKSDAKKQGKRAPETPARTGRGSKDSPSSDAGVAPEPEVSGLDDHNAGGGEEVRAESERVETVDLADTWILETGPKDQVQRTRLPPELAARRKQLAQCLVGAGSEALRLRVAGGKIVEVAVDGAAAPGCVKTLVGARVSGVDVGWIRLRVKR